MQLPLRGNIRITSHFRSKARPDHTGTDMVSDNTNVYAPESGNAIHRYDPISGYGVNIYSENRKWELIHLNQAGRASGYVREGQLIGNYKPGSGKISGPHLHFALQIPHSGPQIDAYKYVIQSSEEVITNNDADILRIVSSEVKGWNFKEVHSGKYDQQELNAWRGLPIARLIREGWHEGQQFHDNREKALAYYANRAQIEKLQAEKDKIIGEQIKTIAELSARPSKQELQDALNKIDSQTKDLNDAQKKIEELKKPTVEKANPLVQLLKRIFHVR